ncbi:hypothetical protein VTI28DRAFT_10052 [Corynascus sepedonium]
MSSIENDRLRVVIVGAGVAGLTLANALEQAGVDYVLLERRSEVAPQIGASIGIFPSAARILDQLGAWKGVSEAAAPLQVFQNRDRQGNHITTPDRSPLLLRARTGYSTAWGERQTLLRVLHDNIKDSSKVLVNKGLADIKHEADGVTAICEDGSSYSGHLLVGTDGVFSKTRSKMWELAESDHPELVRVDRNCLISEYNCIFGIAQGVTSPVVQPGDVNTCYHVGRCALSITAEGGKMYWFAQERLPRTYHLGEIPRYTDDDARDFVARHADLIYAKGSNGQKLTLPDLWEKTTSFRLVAIEEAKFKLWHWGRIVCAGDSIHKATPNLGVGGNSAIESAAALANGIKRLADQWNSTGRRSTKQEIEEMLAEYQRSRTVRAEAVVDSSGILARSHNMQGWGRRLFVKFVLPHLTEFVPELMGNAIIGATKLDYLPLPMASLSGTKPFNPTQGEGLRESKLKRSIYALPLLGLAFTAAWVMDVNPVVEWAIALRDSGVFELPSGGSVPILRTFYHLPSFDDFVAMVNTFFFPAMYGTDLLSRRQTLSFLTDGVVLLTIWIFESARRASLLTPVQWPNFYAAIGQLLGIGVISPIYCFLHYVVSPIENFSALDQRLTNTRVSFAALPTVVLAYLLPFYALITWPDLAFRQALLFVWQLYPVWASAALFVISRVFFKDTMLTDKVFRTQRDLPVMRLYVGGAAVLSAAVWWWTWLEYGLFNVFVPSGLPRSRDTLAGFTAEFLRWDETFGFGSHLVWLGYLFWDLQAAGMLREGWFKVAGLGLVSLLLVGPGATLGIGWLFREHILATRRHKNALTPESVGRLHGSAF